MPRNVRLRFFTSRQRIQRKRVDMKLCNVIGRAHQTEKLPLGGFHRRIRHHIEEPNMQLTNILMKSVIFTQDRLTFLCLLYTSRCV